MRGAPFNFVGHSLRCAKYHDSMEIRRTFLNMLQFMRHFLGRIEPFLIITIVLSFLQTFAQILAFVLIVGGVRAAVANTEISFMQFHLTMFPNASVTVAVGVALLGLATMMDMARIMLTMSTAARFGISVITRLEPQWDELGVKRKRYAFRLASLATGLSRLGCNVLAPVVSFITGVLILGFIEPALAGLVLAVGAVAIFAFVPTNILEARDGNPEFNPNVSAEVLADSKAEIVNFLSIKLSNFRSRRLIRSINLMVFFLALAVLATFVDLNWAVARYAEAVVVIIIVTRGSVSSLVRVSMMMRVMGKNLDALDTLYAVFKTGRLDTTTELVDVDMNDEG